MSIESAKEFFERIKTDVEFASQIMYCEDKKVRRALAEKEGFNFTKAELSLVAHGHDDGTHHAFVNRELAGCGDCSGWGCESW